jgi:hypothetical protein
MFAPPSLRFAPTSFNPEPYGNNEFIPYWGLAIAISIPSHRTLSIATGNHMVQKKILQAKKFF